MRETDEGEKREITSSFKKWVCEVGTRDQAETRNAERESISRGVLRSFEGGRRGGFGWWSE